MKVLFVLASISLALAVDFKMEINEGGKFTEDVKIDVDAGTEEVKVPAHLDRTAVDMLNDFKTGYSASKIDALKVCHISAIDKSEQTPRDMKKSMEASKGKFSSSRYTVVNQKILPLREMSEAEVGMKIAAHCMGYKLVLVGVYTDEDVNEVAAKIMRNAMRSGKAKRTVVQDFTACTTASTNTIENCMPQSRIAARCHFRRRDARRCIYKINCSQGAGGFNCGDSHIMSTLMCCDFICN